MVQNKLTWLETILYALFSSAQLNSEKSSLLSCGNLVHGTSALFNDHVGKLGHFDLCVVPFLHQVHNRKRRAFHYRAGSRSVAVITLRLLTSSCTAESLVSSGLQDPVLRPRYFPEVDVMFLPTARLIVRAAPAVAQGPVYNNALVTLLILYPENTATYTPVVDFGLY